MALSIILPAIAATTGRSRTAVCRNNLKTLAAGLNLWKDNSLTGYYPVHDMAATSHLHPWEDMISMTGQYTPSWIELNRSWLVSLKMPPEDFHRTVDDTSVFMCPADHPHPHRINIGRSSAWGFSSDGYEYSYGINTSIEVRNLPVTPKFAKDTSTQVLCIDGLWDFTINFSAYYIDDPTSYYGTGGWYCNTVGYFHGSDPSANLGCVDGSIKSVRWGTEGSGIDTNKIFFREAGEALNAPNY